METRLEIYTKRKNEMVILRKSLGISQMKLASLSGVSWDTIKNLEQGRSFGSTKTWESINGALQLMNGILDKKEIEVK